MLVGKPATARDVRLANLTVKRGVAVLFLTHGLGDRAAVMQAGEIVERALVAAMFARPARMMTGVSGHA